MFLGVAQQLPHSDPFRVINMMTMSRHIVYICSTNVHLEPHVYLALC